MRAVILTVLYPSMINDLYRRHPELLTTSFQEQKKTFDDELMLWASAWRRALSKKDFKVETICLNAERLLESWSMESGLRGYGPKQTVIEQVKKWKPELLWYDHFDAPFLRKLKSEVPSIRFCLGWVGSSIPGFDALREMDLVFSCAPESVETLTGQGIPAAHLHHAFDQHWSDKVKVREKKYAMTFIGQIVRKDDFHQTRESLLKHLSGELPISIFSPTYEAGLTEVLLTPFKQAGFLLTLPLKRIERIRRIIEKNESVRKTMELKHLPRFPFDISLKRKLKPPVFGIDMLQLLAESDVVLNIHADSSPRYASNMRLFETTGVGSCLLTEERQNIGELFDPENEVVTYRSPAECAEKATWLLGHRKEMEEIGKRAQARTLRQHTYDNRADEFLEILWTRLAIQNA